MKQVRFLTILSLLLLTYFQILSQTKGIIIDKTTHKPISFVNIYTVTNGKVFGTTSNENGKFEVGFPYHSLVFSHINYLKAEIEKNNLLDFVFLTPKEILLGEVVINNKKPEWIGSILNEVVRQKYKNYRKAEQQLNYKFETHTLADSSGYIFNSNGFLKVPMLVKNEDYKIIPVENTIKYKDKSAGPDFMQFRRLIYNDFIKKFDNSFIKNYSLFENSLFENKNKNLVQLTFKSKKYKDDRGYIVVDTLNKVIIEFEQKSGTDYNVNTNTASILRNYAFSNGYKFKEWQTYTKASYSKINGSYQLTECKYRFYQKTVLKNKKSDYTYFNSIESQLNLEHKGEIRKNDWIALPKPIYLVAIMTKKMQNEENALL